MLSQETAPANPSATESGLLKIVLMHEDLVDWVAAHLDIGWIDHTLVREVVAERLVAHQRQTWVNLAGFLAQSSPQVQTLITEVTTAERPMPHPAQQLKDVTLRLRNQALTRQMAQLLQKMNQPETSEEQRLELLRQQHELRLLKNRPLN